MYGRIIVVLFTICALAYAGIQPLKMNETSLIEHINNRHLAKREALPWWEKIVDAIVNWLRQTIFHLGMFGINYKEFSDGMKKTFKDILGVKY